MNRHQFSSKQKIQLSSSCATKAAPPLLILMFGSFCGFEDFCSIFYFLFFFKFFFWRLLQAAFPAPSENDC